MKRTLKKGLKVYEPAGCGEKLNLGKRLLIVEVFSQRRMSFLLPSCNTDQGVLLIREHENYLLRSESNSQIS